MKQVKCNDWKSYPFRIAINRISKCHSSWLFLCESMEGGFVSANCYKCGNKDTVKEDDFKKLPVICCCPDCKKPMMPEIYENNYCYICHNCDICIRLVDLLPHWSEMKQKGNL